MASSLKKFVVKFMKGRMVNGCLRVRGSNQKLHKRTVRARDDQEAMARVRSQFPGAHSMWAQEVR